MQIDPAYIQFFLFFFILFGFWLIFPKDLKIFTLSLLNAFTQFNSIKSYSDDSMRTGTDAEIIESFSILKAKFIGLVIFVVGIILLFRV